MSLLDAARAVRDLAHAPYSGFPVGAALRSESGAVFVGCNVENVASPEGTCAETGAITAMVAAGQRRILEICIIADSPVPITPCGGCRQRIAEFAGPDTPVIMATLSGQIERATLGELLPGAFSPRHRGRG
ncbi:cytidine deaminase [Alkalilacustris brevis]|uniref:cytidine deaminase n=1 Tax=Alkalilacustris brevis TaxID=2026338 RepID=UPI0013905542|nr:cytidine deaminase [Alkalilacustris brevis]